MQHVVDLRATRESLGLSLNEASARARIPAHYLAAMESGNREVLPSGPFRRGYQRQYLEFLGLDPNTPILEPTLSSDLNTPSEEPTQTVTMALNEVPMGRLVMSGFVLTMVVVLLLRVLFEVTGSLPDANIPATAEAAFPAEEVPPENLSPDVMPTSRLRIRAIEPTRITTRVDSQDSYRGTLPAGEIIDLMGREQIEVYATDLTTIRITYNGERIEPLGNLSKPRRLVFIQD
ncbi:MAG: cytoskeletal protein RodZ [Myxococcota bacterium]